MLAQELSKTFNLSREQEKLLEEGSVLPDYQEDFPHHIGKDNEIKKLLHNSRVAFNRNDDECYYLLGMAFHYLQDKWTLRARTRDKHTKWEEMISNEAILKRTDFEKAITEAPIPSKFKQVYLNYLGLLIEGLDSEYFWRDHIETAMYNQQWEVMDSTESYEPYVSMRALRHDEEEIKAIAEFRRCKSLSKMELQTERLEKIRIDEDKKGFEKRVFCVITEAWNEGKTGNLFVFKNALLAETSSPRYSSPQIDLNIAYYLCREIGRRLLSQNYKWLTDNNSVFL